MARAATAARSQWICGILAWGGRGALNPWLLFVLTCLLMAAVLGIIALLWTEGFARLARFAASRARAGRGARPPRQVE